MSIVQSKTLIYPNQDQAICAKKRLAAKGASAALGIEFTTPYGLIRDSWELYGDERRLISDTERLLIVSSLLSDSGLDQHVGTAQAISAFFEDCYLAIVSSDAGICETRAELAIHEMAHAYKAELENRRLVEGCEAASMLVDRLRAHKGISFGAPCPLTGYVKDLYCNALELEIPSFDPDDLVGPKAFEVLLPAGRTVIDKMVYDEVSAAMDEPHADAEDAIAAIDGHPSDAGRPSPNGCNAGREGFSVAICTQDPMAMYEAFARTPLAKRYAFALDCAVGFASTAFGKAFMAFAELLQIAAEEDRGAGSGRAWILPASDFSTSPFAQIARYDESDLPSMRGKGLTRELKGAHLDGIWRSDRTLSAKDALADLAFASKSFQSFAALAEASDGEARTGAVEQLMRIAAARFSGAQLIIERGAVQALQSLLEAAAGLGLTRIDVLALAKTISTRSSDIGRCSSDASASAREGSARADDGMAADEAVHKDGIIQFLPISSASELGPSTFDEVIICDVSDEAFNSRHIVGSLDRLALKLGVDIDGSSAQRTRLSFAHAVSASSRKLVCVLPQHGYDASDSFSSFCFDELLEARFGGEVKASDIIDGNLRALPCDVSEVSGGRTLVVRELGEENLQAGAGRRMVPPSKIMALAPVERGQLIELSLPDRMRHVGDHIVLSASSIQEYLACPYQWFVDRVLKPRQYGEGLGPIETGSFAHRVLERLYAQLIADGASTIQNLSDEQLRGMLDATFESELEAQRSLPIGSGRYIPISRVEWVQARSLMASMGDAVILEQLLPSDFKPIALEKRIDPAEEGSRYAGFAITGMVDRIDADDGNGMFYVLDYKGSLRDHECGEALFQAVHGDDGSVRFDPDAIPPCVQTLVYASVVRQLLGQRCVAALYTSYRATSSKGLVVGAFSTSMPALDAISDANSRVDGSFCEFLELAEQAIAVRLQGIRCSKIGADNSSSSSCRYCNLASRGCR